MWVVALGLFLVYWAIIIFKHTIFASQYKILDVVYDDEAIKLYDDPYLYKDVHQLFSGNNYYMQKFFRKRSLLHSIQENYPMVKSFGINYLEQHKIILSVEFFEPDIIIMYKDQRFALQDEYNYELFSGNQLGASGVQELRLPLYLGELKQLDGLFFDIRSHQLIEQLLFIEEHFPQHDKIVYLPGAQRFAVILASWQKIYISCARLLQEQFDNYDKLVKYYDWVSKLQEIDLSSLPKTRVIVKK